MLIAMAGSFDENFHHDKPSCACVKNFPKRAAWNIFCVSSRKILRQRVGHENKQHCPERSTAGG
jgi:hypothetical protein